MNVYNVVKDGDKLKNKYMKGKLELLEGKNEWVVISEDGIEVWPLDKQDYPPFIFTMEGSIFDKQKVDFQVIDGIAKLPRPFSESWDYVLKDHKDGHVRLTTGNYATLADYLRENYYPPRRIEK
jgi:hypothetical protein